MAEAALAAPFWGEPAVLGPGGLRILVVYGVEPGGIKDRSWNDGFVAALRLLSDAGHVVTWLNMKADGAAAAYPAAAREADVVLAKSNWGWIVDRFVRALEAEAPTGRPRAIMVSGISGRISRRRGRFYDVVFYQTEWYRKRLSRRLRTVHAYGMNTEAMRLPDAPVEPVWDWLYVGAFTPNRRPELLLGKTGRRLAVGEISRSDSDIVDRLRADGVEVRDVVPYDELRELYWSARCVYVPAALDGGGERQLMEAIACGRPVEIAPDNPKLAEVVASAPIWTEAYFAGQLEAGLRAAVAARTG